MAGKCNKGGNKVPDMQRSRRQHPTMIKDHFSATGKKSLQEWLIKFKNLLYYSF
jgi:hypothetical protein